MSMRAPSRRAAVVIAIALLFLSVLVRFRGAVLTFYFLDDYWVMRDAARVRLESIWDVAQFFHLGHAGFGLYRPFTTVAYGYLLHQLFGYDSSGYHAFQLLVFAFNVVLAFAITRRLTQSVRAAFAAGLLYSLAPGQAVDAYWLSAFTVTGTVTWLLLLAWAWLALRSWARVLVCTLLQIGGLLASEHAVAGPALLVILSAMRREPWRRSAAALVPGGVLVAAYLVVKMWYFTYVRVLTFYAVGFEPGRLVQQLGQYFVACFNLLSLPQPSERVCLFLGIGLILFFLVAAWRALRGSAAWRLVAGGMAFFAVSLGPVIVLRSHYYDHYVCLASLGAAWAVLGVCQLLTRQWRWLGVAVAGLLLVCDVATGERAWRANHVFRLVVNGAASAAVWMAAVQRAGQADQVEVFVPAQSITDSVFAVGEAHTFFPGQPARVTRYRAERPPRLGAGQVIVNIPPLTSVPPLDLEHPAPGWDPRWNWLRRLAGSPPRSAGM